MNRRHLRWGFALALAPLAACASNPPPAPPAPPPPPPLASNDAQFVPAIAQASLTEIAEAQLALQKTKSPAVQQFAQTMIQDHTKMNDQLAPIAQAHGVVLPTAPNDMQQQQISMLQTLKGPRFVHAYVADQIQDHQAALQLAEDEAANGTDPALKQYAQTGAPIIQSHIDMAKQLQVQGHHRMMRHHHHHTTTSS